MLLLVTGVCAAGLKQVSEYQRDYRLTQKVNQRLGADPNPQIMPGVSRGKWVASLCKSEDFKFSEFLETATQNPSLLQAYANNASLFQAISDVAIEECSSL
jgi:hypothetical protein